MSIEIFTIGVYGMSEQQFFDKLLQNSVDTFCDIRRRRAVRGSTYSFVNSKKLQEKLKLLGINYLHFLDLAPSNETREKQKEADKKNSIIKKDRDILSTSFIMAYEKECLCDFDCDSFINKLGEASKKIVLFCVEAKPSACHRSLVAKKLADKFKINITNL